MQTFSKPVRLENTCIGLGFFDGVHTGHRALIDKLVSKSEELGAKSCLITFQSSPAEMFTDNVKYLNQQHEKEELLSDLGLDYLIMLDFNKELMEMSAQEYLDKILCANLSPKYIISGFNHTFGKNKSGNSDFLRENQVKYGYIYEELPPVVDNGEVVSSTLIKSALSKGDIERANKLLGYEYSLDGVVVHGRQLGRTIGFPTANIDYPIKKTKIPYGVYCAEVKVRDKRYAGMLNYGIKPTVNTDMNKPVAEVYIIGFNGDIYGESIRIFIKKMIRDEKRFNSLDELKQQINEDLKQC